MAAVALVGALRTLYERYLAAAASGQDAKDVVAALPHDIQRAFDLLERGLGTYATADSPTLASPRHTP